MLSGMRFYIVSIVSIFIALGIGIYIGFSIDSQELIFDQKENIINILESQFELLTEENHKVKEENKLIILENELINKYIDESYEFIIKNRLDGMNIGIIETNSDYIISSIGNDLEDAGAKVVNLTTLNSSIVNRIDLDDTISIILNSIINGKVDDDFLNLKDKDIVKFMGSYDQPIDYLVISGGSVEDSRERINKIDKSIIEISKEYNIPIIGIEKHDVDYSYMGSYNNFGITTVDNVDMIMGKVALILAMEGMPGNYGIKPTAKTLIPRRMEILNNY